MSGNSRYLDIFLKEAEEHLTALQGGVVQLERAPGDREMLRELMRNAHTLKGAARMLGFDSISAVGHRLEDLLEDLEGGKRQVDAPSVDLLLKGVDAVSRLVNSLRTGTEESFDLQRFLDAFDQGEVPAEAFAPAPQEERGIGDTVRAKVKTIDSLVNRLGELIISGKRFDEKSLRLKAIAGALPEGDERERLIRFLRELDEDVHYLHYLAQELHEDALELRMLPLKTITDGLERLVRDLAREQGKVVDFRVVGENVELDRTLLDALKPALLHLVRNAVDHGIESLEERLVAGKPPKGTVSISAGHDGSRVKLTIQDDGRGINPVLVREAALRKGIIGKEEASLLGDEESLYLVFEPGFSTRDFITDISGRGIGMDVVKKSVEKAKGQLSLASTIGRFTEVSLILPLTLSLIEALLVRVGGETFAIPLNFILETVKVRQDDLLTSGGKEVVILRGMTIPLVSLSTFLGFETGTTLLKTDRLTAVILRFRDQYLACPVDGTIGGGEVVVKGVGEQLAGVESIAGATILGDGNPALILNVPHIFSRAERQTRTGFRSGFAETEAARSRARLLVVDDSITTRAMERSILVAHGYEVEVAISGEEALEKVARTRFDLVVTDIQMPGIDGFELTRRLRGLAGYEDVPIVIVSSLSRDEDKRKAMESGAQAYIVKGSFDQGTLLDAVEALIG